MAPSRDQEGERSAGPCRASRQIRGCIEAGFSSQVVPLICAGGLLGRLFFFADHYNDNPAVLADLDASDGAPGRDRAFYGGRKVALTEGRGTAGHCFIRPRHAGR
jgi:hypothetical protein